MRSEASVYQDIRRAWKQETQRNQREYSRIEHGFLTGVSQKSPIASSYRTDMDHLKASIAKHKAMLSLYKADDKEQEEIEQDRIRKERDSYD
jgi:hypothetical protein